MTNEVTNAHTYLKWTPQMKRDHSHGENTDDHGRADATPTNLRALQLAAPFAEFCDRLFAIAEEVDAYDLRSLRRFLRLVLSIQSL